MQSDPVQDGNGLPIHLSTSGAHEVTDVAVAILWREDGTMLLCQRAATGRYPLQWEFPGGKVESGEDPEEAVRRELFEELSIHPTVGAILYNKQAYYADGGMFNVRYYEVRQWMGEVANRIFNDVRWVHPTELCEYDVLDGNIEVCQMLSQVK